MKKTLTLGIMVLALFAMSAQAETEHCHTTESCRALIAGAQADLAELLRDARPELTGILETGVTQQTAIEVCRERGMRLPTARELAMVAQSLGAEGISERRKDGYRLIKGSDVNGNPDHFYFNYRGYQRPEGDLGRKWFFWSSSVHTHDSSVAYGLYASNGDVYTTYRSYDNKNDAVLCMQSL